MTWMTKLGRATRALTAALAITGVPAVLASAQTARAFDPQATEAAWDDEINRQAAGQPHGSYASAHRDRHTPTKTPKDFQDLK